MYGYIYVADRDEGLILVPAGTLLDGNPLNNFLGRELTFNPGGILNGARASRSSAPMPTSPATPASSSSRLDDPKHPEVTSVVGEPFLKHPRAVQVQFRYAFVCDEEGIKVLDVTDLAHPAARRDVCRCTMPAASTWRGPMPTSRPGRQGLVILDIERPTEPRVDQVFNAGGCINDLHDVKLGITYISEFAYLADGKNGLRVVQLTSPETPGNDGLQPAADAPADRHLQAAAGRPRPGDLRRASTATAPSTRAATRSASSAGSARGP